jgi:uncharacterized membrane protein YvlD (DUF360 family)
MQPLNLNITLIRNVSLRYLLVWVADAVSLAATAAVLPGIYFRHDTPFWYLYPFIVALLLGLMNALVRPVLLLFLLPITFATLGIATLVLNAALFYLANVIVDSFVISNFASAVMGILFLTLVNTILGNLVRLTDDYSFYATLMNKFSTLTRPRRLKFDAPGVVLLQIDGLSYDTLKRAVRRGKMPFVSDLLKRRKYVLRSWFSGLPSQTSSVQAGLFYGSCYDIPGFRWYDKEARRLIVSSNSADMSAVDERLSSYREPLLRSGSCINSLLHGGARRRILTLSAKGEKGIAKYRGEFEDFAIFSLHPYLYTRAILYVIGDFIVDRVQAMIDTLRRRKDRIRRSPKFSFLRAVANAGFRESTAYFIMEDVVRGMPIIYANFVGYDMVSHYAGPDSSDAIGTLTGIDRKLRKIFRTISKKAPRHFDFIVISDHGQSRSVPFTTLYNVSLSEFMANTLERPTIEQFGDTAEVGYFKTLLSEIRRADQTYGSRSIRTHRLTLEKLNEKISDDVVEEREDEAFVVCASGNLAHIYLTHTPKRLAVEDIIEQFPDLLETLVGHPGIGFIVTVRENGEILMLGRDGMRNLRNGDIEGDDPMVPYMIGREGVYTTRALAELAAFPHSGDIIVNGAVLDDGRVVSFEKQVGTHGGLGGPQTEPFIIYPKRLKTKRDTLQNPEEVHLFLAGLLAREKTS